MATCPKCNQAMPMTATICPHCGYDFPTRAENFPRDLQFRGRTGFAYSSFAEFALFVGTLASALGAVALLVAAVVLLFNREWPQAAGAFIAFWVQLAFYVVFQRVSDMK